MLSGKAGSVFRSLDAVGNEFNSSGKARKGWSHSPRQEHRFEDAV